MTILKDLKCQDHATLLVVMYWMVPNTLYWQVEVSKANHLYWIFSNLAGTVFLLALVAITKLRSRVRNADLTHKVVQHINHHLRVPAPGT